MAKQNQIIRSKRSFTNASHLKVKMQQGIALLESMIAIVIFSMGILALAGLQSVLVKNTSDAKYRAEATFIAQQSLGMAWIGKGDIKDANKVDTDIPLPNGTRTVVVSDPPECVVTVTVTWQLPGEEEHTYTTNARIQGVKVKESDNDCAD